MRLSLVLASLLATGLVVHGCGSEEAEVAPAPPTAAATDEPPATAPEEKPDEAPEPAVAEVSGGCCQRSGATGFHYTREEQSTCKPDDYDGAVWVTGADCVEVCCKTVSKFDDGETSYSTTFSGNCVTNMMATAEAVDTSHCE